MCQKHLQTVHVIYEQLFDRSGSLFLHEAKRKLLQPFLQCLAQPEKRVIRRPVRHIQSPAIEPRLQTQTYQHSYNPDPDKLR